jgi:GxxExxY protein
MRRVQSPLPEEVEQLMRATIGCCIAVHRELGPGLRERIYSRAIAIELKAAGIEFEREKKYPVTYRGELLCDQKLDFVVANEIVLEVKSVEHLAAIHHTQIVNYMRIARRRAGLLLNFNVIVLPDGMSRKVL